MMDFIEGIASLSSKEKLLEYSSRYGNNRCADCNALDPSWASVNNHVLICTQCSGVHRSLGVEYSFVQSLKLDEWTDETVNIFLSKASSTSEINENILEYHVPGSYLKPSPKSSRLTREKYIRSKYVDKVFTFKEGIERMEPVQEIESDLIALSESSSTENNISIGSIEFIGVLMVKLKSARNLVKADIIGKSDPYCILKLGKQQLKSKTIFRTLNPDWNEDMMLSWDGSSSLLLEVYDHDNFNDDGIIYIICTYKASLIYKIS
jgi:stromal membrane-associated protein